MGEPSISENTTLRGKVLYIEDQDLNMMMVEAMLSVHPGIEFVKATTGTQGVEMVRRVRPDLVILDMHLPDFGGLEVVRALSEEISNGLKIALLTSDRLSMDIIKAMSLGAFEYWLKPLDRKQLTGGLQRALGGATAGR